MCELPAKKIQPDRNRPPEKRLVPGSHRHDLWLGSCLVLLLPDRTTSDSDPTESALAFGARRSAFGT